jgi:hypothetical protein
MEDNTDYGLSNIDALTPIKRKRGRPRKSLAPDVDSENLEFPIIKTFMDQFPNSNEKDLLMKSSYITPENQSGYQELKEGLRDYGARIPRDDKFEGPIGCFVFQLNTRRDNRWYGISLDVARHLGYRDSSTFYLKNEKFDKIWASEIERYWLADIKALVPASYRLKDVALVPIDQVYQAYRDKLLFSANEAKMKEKERLDNDLDVEYEDDEPVTVEDDSVHASKLRRIYIGLSKTKKDPTDRSWLKSSFDTASFNAHLARERELRANSSLMNDETTRITMCRSKYFSSDVESVEPVAFFDDLEEPSEYPIDIMDHQYQENFAMYSPQWTYWYTEQMKRKYTVPTSRSPKKQPLSLSGDSIMKNERPACKTCSSSTIKQLNCRDCGNVSCYSCIGVDAVSNQEWKCRDCSKCKLCNTSKKGSVVTCSQCLQWFHSSCLDPMLSDVKRFVCSSCISCASCKAQPKSTTENSSLPKWKQIYVKTKDEETFLETLCPKCSVKFDNGDFCPCCHKVYDTDLTSINSTRMISCDSCSRNIHIKCDKVAEKSMEVDDYVDYFCPICREFKQLKKYKSFDKERVKIAKYNEHLLCLKANVTLK